VTTSETKAQPVEILLVEDNSVKKEVIMEFVKRFSVVFAVSLALMGCGPSLDKQVSQLAEKVTKLEQEAAQSKEAINRLQKEIATARESVTKLEQSTTQSIEGAVSKLAQDQASLKADQQKALAHVREALTKLKQAISQQKSGGKPGVGQAPLKKGPEKPPTQ
jgi:archaellum component FlaC